MWYANTFLLYKYLKVGDNKIIFFNLDNSNVVDPVINLKFSKSTQEKINKLVLKYNFDIIFINTSKLLNTYKKFFKTKDNSKHF